VLGKWFSLIVVILLLTLGVSLVTAHEEHAKVGPAVTIQFDAVVGDRPARCGMAYEGLGTGDSGVVLNDFRFFVSNVRLVSAAGEEVPVVLTQDGLWQYENVALLDFEDGTAGCSEAGNSALNNKISGEVPEGEYTGIVFDLGVPFELDHLDTTTAPAPLNIPAMWWNWQVGYKFVRIDLMTPEGALPAWFIHLGSTACKAADGNTPPAEPCGNPNFSTIRLDGFNPAHNFVVADLAGLVAGVNLNENTPEPPGCMSMPMDPDCMTLFPGFGLNIVEGVTQVADTQSFFRMQ